MSSSSGLSRFIHGLPSLGEQQAARQSSLPGTGPAYPSRLPGDACDLEREYGVTTVRYVFALIWPRAGIACHAGATGCRVEVRQCGLHHAVHVPWALVEFDQGLLLVRAIYRAGLPGVLQRAVSALSLSL